MYLRALYLRFNLDLRPLHRPPLHVPEPASACSPEDTLEHHGTILKFCLVGGDVSAAACPRRSLGADPL